MHALLADSHQPFQTATYSPIVSESVALTHERFLIRHLDSLVVADDQRSALCLRVLDTAFTSFFTQVMFLDFEVQAHALIECGEAATEEALCDLYARIANQYFAGAVEIDDFYRWTWARVGHFFRSPFYSASYALSFVASAKLFKGMTTGTAAEQELARIRFIDMLQSGGSRAPFELFEAAGVSVDIAGTIAAVAEEVEEQLRCFHD